MAIDVSLFLLALGIRILHGHYFMDREAQIGEGMEETGEEQKGMNRRTRTNNEQLTLQKGLTLLLVLLAITPILRSSMLEILEPRQHQS